MLVQPAEGLNPEQLHVPYVGALWVYICFYFYFILKKMLRLTSTVSYTVNNGVKGRIRHVFLQLDRLRIIIRPSYLYLTHIILNKFILLILISR